MNGAFDGFLALLWENFKHMGDSDPDSFTALDFDDLNLDFLLLTSELQSYNQHSNYVYKNTENIFHPYSQNFANTLGYLEMKVKEASNNQFDAIIPINLDGRPEYQFVNSTTHSLTLPLSVLYKPIVLSEERYNDIQPNLGHLVITSQCKDYNNTKGIDSYKLTSIEQQAGFKAKIPISNKQFEYPIQSISIDVMKQKGLTINYLFKDIIIDESYYIIEDGSLYFTKSLEEIISESYLEFETVLQQANLLTTTIHYNVHILFDRFIPDNTTETSSLALAQATTYAIMDYFNQYTYAEVSANMISEIAYTETLTFWSTLISVPLAYFGSLAATAVVGKLASKAGSELVSKLLAKQVAGLSKMFISLIIAPIKEVLEEIIKDGFIEAIAENLVDLAGGTEALGYWVSALGTSAREVGGALGQLALGQATPKANFKTKLSLLNARITGNTKLASEIKTQIKLDMEQKIQNEQQKRMETKTWQKFFNAGMFKGLAMMTSSLFFGGSSFFTLLGFNTMLQGTVGIAPKVYGEAKTIAHAKRKVELTQDFGTMNLFSGKNLDKQMKKPSEIDAGALHNLFNSLQKADTTTEVDSPPLTIEFPTVNPSSKSIQRDLLTNKFSEVSLLEDLSYQSEMKKDYNEIEQKTIAQGIEQTSKNKESLGRMPELLEVGEYEVLHPDKEMTIKDFLSDLNLDGIERKFGVLVNGKKIDLETIIKPIDDIVILPHLGGGAPYGPSIGPLTLDQHNLEIVLLHQVHNIEEKIELELEKPAKDQRPCLAFLEASEIETLENFYNSRRYRPYDGSAREGVQSPYTAHYKFFIDQLSSILLDNEIISRYNYEVISELLSTSSYRPHIADFIRDLKQGNNNRFTIAEDTLYTYYAEVWWVVENSINNEDIKRSIFQQLDDLFNMQNELYGYSKNNPLYGKLRNSYIKLFKTVNMVDKILVNSGDSPILSSPTKGIFKKVFHFSFTGEYEAFDKSSYIPWRDTWLSLKDRIINEFESRSLGYFNSFVEDIMDEALYHIDNQRRVENLLADFPDGDKKEFLLQIINCPDTDILKLTEKQKDLSFLLFGIYTPPQIYLRDVYFAKIAWRSIDSFDRAVHRISLLELSDFEKVGLRSYIDSNTLKKLKEHSENVMNEFISSHHINSYDSVGITYHTKELRDLQLDTIRTLWTAAVYHSDKDSISYGEFCEIYNIPRDFYNPHITHSVIINTQKSAKFASKLDEWLVEESSSIITPTNPLSYSSIINDPTSSWISTKKSLAYLEAREKLLEFETHKQNAIDFWMKSDTADKTWFSKLFAPTSSGYAFGFNEPLYRAFSTTIGLLELFATEPISGISIPDAAFDASDSAFRSARHHFTSNRLSLALYDQIPTIEQFGIHKVYESMSQAQQNILKQKLRELMITGILKSDSQGRSSSNLDLLQNRNSLYYAGTNVKQWVTLQDFLKIFPTTLTFTFTHDGLSHTSSLLEAWEIYFGRHLHFGGFDEKLFDINEKIQKFRDDLKAGYNPYEGFLEEFHPIAEERFFEDAKVFAGQLWRLMDNNMFSGLYNERDLVNRWHIYLMKRSFEI